ncbi:MAG: sulfatase, partial [Verrucomicrobiae bacterium]|nr:sulfatase [Verrucomicrobiae bacterium]
PEYEMHRRAPNCVPYNIKDNPLPALLEAARTANAMNPANIPQLAALLEHNDPAMRWWGATGLVALGPNAKPAEKAIRKTLTDEAPEVR